MSKRAASPDGAPSAGAAKKARQLDAALAPSLDGWLNPAAEAPLVAMSPALNVSSSTFVGFSLSFEPGTGVRTREALHKEAARAVRALDVVRLVGAELIDAGEGAFAHGEGRAPGRRDRPRAREPDHRMWAVRTLGLREGRDGTAGEGDYQLLEASEDDGEKYGGERVLRVLGDVGAVDVLTIVCRWFGGDLLGPQRFNHIGTVAHTSTKELVALVTRRDLRAALVALDKEIAEMRKTVAAAPSSSQPDPSSKEGEGGDGGANVPLPTLSVPKPPDYDAIDDIPRLQRLVRAREMTQKSLEKRVGWAARTQAETAAGNGSDAA